MAGVTQIADNNVKYGEWWIENIGDKAKVVINAVKSNENYNRKLVRVKMYNAITLKMEEHFLADVLNAMIKLVPDLFPSSEKDDKNQVNLWGPYFISFLIYDFVVKVYNAPTVSES
jgi:hypothetical protein